MTFGSLFAFMHDRSDDILELAGEQISMAATAVAIATVISVSAGVWAYVNPRLRAPFDAIANIFMTIPAFAYFAVAVLIPFIGLGNRAAVAAMILYSILPIMRNTLAGLDGVDRGVVEAAEGVGLSPRARLMRVEFPLAVPTIVAGIRTAAIMDIGIASVAALVGGGGLGLLITDGLSRFPLPSAQERIWAGTLAIVMLAAVVDLLFSIAERVLNRPKG